MTFVRDIKKTWEKVAKVMGITETVASASAAESEG